MRHSGNESERGTESEEEEKEDRKIQLAKRRRRAAQAGRRMEGCDGRRVRKDGEIVTD